MPGVGTAAAPLAPMVTMPVPSAMVALVGVPRVTRSSRWGVEPERSRMGTVMFWAVSPGGKVSMPLCGAVVGAGVGGSVVGGVGDGDGDAFGGARGPAQHDGDVDGAGALVDRGVTHVEAGGRRRGLVAGDVDLGLEALTIEESALLADRFRLNVSKPRTETLLAVEKLDSDCLGGDAGGEGEGAGGVEVAAVWQGAKGVLAVGCALGGGVVDRHRALTRGGQGHVEE